MPCRLTAAALTRMNLACISICHSGPSSLFFFTICICCGSSYGVTQILQVFMGIFHKHCKIKFNKGPERTSFAYATGC